MCLITLDKYLYFCYNFPTFRQREDLKNKTKKLIAKKIFKLVNKTLRVIQQQNILEFMLYVYLTSGDNVSSYSGTPMYYI